MQSSGGTRIAKRKMWIGRKRNPVGGDEIGKNGAMPDPEIFLAAIDGKTCVMHEAWKKVTVLFLTSVAELRVFLHFALKL